MKGLGYFIKLFALEHWVGVAAREAHCPVLPNDPLEVLFQHLG